MATRPKKEKFDPKEHIKDGFTEDEIECIKEAFDLFDSTGNGTIDMAEFKNAMSALGFEGKDEVVFQMMTELDKNKSGTLDFSEFLELMTTRMADRDSREELEKVFRLIDDDGSETISIKNLTRVCRELGETMTDKEIEEMINRADTKGDQKITFEEFYCLLTDRAVP